eukprot:CAMPEP_0175131170 /NCGR_PEP_ID=MMETSP0087-20121206/6394_1 /TAXON_ID=136419 /ORGANISM="Unknown Unknown, Strain D1" /LENGTH=470 /DNA_ID=CAMNT_0016413431 /DNA_START=21 /DNA_END=1433 /DNA_ORIENTATION=-
MHLFCFLQVFGRKIDTKIRVEVLATGSSCTPLHRPLGLAFRPTAAGELYVANYNNDSVTVLDVSSVLEAGSNASIPCGIEKKDSLAYHYMSHVTSLAFNHNGTEFASCQDSTNRYDQPEAWDAAIDHGFRKNITDPEAEKVEGREGNNNMGPSLWRTASFALENQFGNHVWRKDPNGTTLYGSHIDMLHQSPMCMGLVHSEGRVYYAVDAGWGNPLQYGSLVKYDFGPDHGEGGSDHTKAVVTRVRGFALKRVPAVAQQIALHKTSDGDVVFIADTGNGRVVKVRVWQGAQSAESPPLSIKNHQLTAYTYTDVPPQAVEAIGKGVLVSPSGVAVRAESSTQELLLFVSDFATSLVHVFFSASGATAMQPLSFVGGGSQLPSFGLSSLAFSPAGTKLFAVQAAQNLLVAAAVPPLKASSPPTSPTTPITRSPSTWSPETPTSLAPASCRSEVVTWLVACACTYLHLTASLG